MSVSICMLMRRVTPIAIGGVLDALVAHNVILYGRGDVKDAPWSLRWKPDDYDNVVILPDVRELQDRGVGSCGPLACAYAAWEIHKGRAAGVQLLSNGPQSWHVVAVSGGQVFDPQIIGGVQQHGQA